MTAGDEILRYFPELTKLQKDQFDQLPDLYRWWNSRINVISRKDVDGLMVRHVLHSLAIAKLIRFIPNTTLLDVGTGGGFPGIPLAILHPDSQFHLIDSIQKKIKVVKAVADALELQNVTAAQERAQNHNSTYDFVISRAVTRMKPFLSWTRNNLSKKHRNAMANGVLYLKGGDLTEELRETGKPYSEFEISNWFDDAFFETKKVIYVPFD